MNDNQNRQGPWWESENNETHQNNSQWKENESQSNKNQSWWESKEGNSRNDSQWKNAQDNTGNTWWDASSVNFPPFFTSAQQELAKRKATTSMILGVVGLALSLVGAHLVGIILGIIALVKSSTAKRLSFTPLTEAKAGKILGILAIVFGGIYIAIAFLAFSSAFFFTLLSIIFG